MRVILLLLTALSILSNQSAVADAARGAELEQNNCTSCHAARFEGNKSAIYLRDNKRVHNYNQLVSQVRFCENNLGLTWFDNQILDVVEHLNQSYYHFGIKK